jgi:repressor LexA
MRFLRAYTAEHGYPPTVREITKAVGLSSPSTTHRYLRQLAESGDIEVAAHTARTIRVLNGP